MKRNKVPEKIYMSAIDLEYMGDCIREPLDKYDIEYIRKDVFIEKALKFLDEKFYFNNLHYSIESGVFDSEEEMFEDFRNYIKGE